MEKWRQFERDSVDYLNTTYGSNRLRFIGTGQSNSTTSDISVIKDGEHIFNIEAKLSEAQSGQFVLLDDSAIFKFSPKNKSLPNEFTDLIIEHINQNYDIFKGVSTSSIPIRLDAYIFEEWIKQHYIHKNVMFVITNSENNDFIILPISKYGEYFEIKANFRIKKSGSRHLAKKHEKDVINSFKEAHGSYSIKWNDKKAYIITDTNISNKTKISTEKYDYQLNEEDEGYLVKMLSKTNNPNVIFSVNLIKTQDLNDLNSFKIEIE